jgi:hypothetical protein
LLGSLGLYNGQAIPFASHIELEIWRSDDFSKYVQVKFNGEVVALPFCGENLLMCELSVFLSYIEKLALTNAEFAELCKI